MTFRSYSMFLSRVRRGVKISFVTTTSFTLLLLSACGGGEPGEASFNLAVVDGALAGDERTFLAAQGDTVTLNLSSDAPGLIHLHGYDLKETVAPGAPSAITFKADATGRFAIEMHATGTACGVDVTGIAIALTAVPADHVGHYLILVETENFEISTTTRNHWHLMSDGQMIGMFFDPSVEIDLGEGGHELKAQLNTGKHCALPVSSILRIGEADSHDGHAASADHDEANDGEAMMGAHDQDAAAGDHNAPGAHAASEDEHDHDAGSKDFNLGALEIRPR